MAEKKTGKKFVQKPKFRNEKKYKTALNEKLTSTFSLFCSTLGTGGGS